MEILQRKVQPSDLEVYVRIFRDTIIFFAILFYFVGWIYLNEYLKSFGLYLSNFSVPLHYVFVFFYAPLFDAVYSPGWRDGIRVLVLTIFVLGCFVAYKARPIVSYTATTVCSICILIVFFQVATERGRLHANYVKNGGGKPIRFSFHKEVGEHKDDVAINLQAANSSREHHCFRLIWQTDEDVYVVDAKCDPLKPTYRIPVSSFISSETLDQVP